jgi:adhesin transport system outer membrane protein
VNKLREQAAFLDQHQLSSDKARQAFRNQFDIGQRTLLDLLDTENEYFQSRRAYINAVHDLAIAQARLHAGMGNLLATLGIAPVEPNAPREVDALTPEAMERCPAEGPDIAMVDKARAIDRAMRLRPQRPTGPVAEPGRSPPLSVPSAPSTQGPKSLAPPPRPISPAQPRESVGPVAPSLPPVPR